MKKRALLVNPWIFDVAAYDYWLKPLGLLYIASYLIENGVQVRVIDCLSPYSPEGVADPTIKIPKRKTGGHGKFPRQLLPLPRALEGIASSYHRYGMSPAFFETLLQNGPRPDIILITAMMTYWYPGAFDAIETLRRVFPGVPIVLGGLYATLCPEHAAHSGADYRISGSAEDALPFLIQDLLGLPLTFKPDLDRPDTLPFPAFHLLFRPDQVPILTSRGCPFRCPYCASSLLSPRFVRRQPGKVMEEILHWHHTLGVSDFSFYDDALLTDATHLAEPLLREVIAHRLPVRFHCPNGLHLREISSELANLMFRAGFKTLRFGFETSDLQRQQLLGGKADNSHLDAALAYLCEAGYTTDQIGIYILCGLPGQSASEVFETIHHVRSKGARPILAEYSPIPGTALWEASVQVSPYPLSIEPLFHNNTLLPCRSNKLTLQNYQQMKVLAHQKETWR